MTPHFFTASDFENDESICSSDGHGTFTEIEMCARIANAKLTKMLEDAPTVYRRLPDNYWQLEKHLDYPNEQASYKGKIVCIEIIEKECKEHEPSFGALVAADMFNGDSVNCKHCNKPLKAKWESDE